MRKTLLLAALACMAITGAKAQQIVPLSYGNFDQWVTRHVKESGIIGGAEKKVFEVGPTKSIPNAGPYTNMGGSPWATSNVYAKVAGVVKASNQVYPDRHGNGYCAKLTTQYEHVKALGIVNMDVLATWAIRWSRVTAAAWLRSRPSANSFLKTGRETFRTAGRPSATWPRMPRAPYC